MRPEIHHHRYNAHWSPHGTANHIRNIYRNLFPAMKGHGPPFLVLVWFRFSDTSKRPDITPCFQDAEVDKFLEVSDDRPCLCFHPSIQNEEYQNLVIEAMAGYICKLLVLKWLLFEHLWYLVWHFITQKFTVVIYRIYFSMILYLFFILLFNNGMRCLRKLSMKLY